MKANDLPNTSINIEFCEVLEYSISKAFRNSGSKKYKWIWCDGISLDAMSITHAPDKNLIDITTRGWIGEDGQGEYTVIIYLGEVASALFERKENLVNCIPSTNSTEWLEIDQQHKLLSVRLK